MMRVALTVLAVAIAAHAGCVYHLDRNSPGTVNLHQPPAQAIAGEVEEPGDPGERGLVVSAGALAGAGGRVGSDSGVAAEVAAELSFHYGEFKQSHERGTLIAPLPLLPARRRGVNLGFVFLEPDKTDDNKTELGPAYVEWHDARTMWSWAAGYGVDFGDGTHGPQVSATFAGAYAKASYRFDRGAEFMLGLVLKLPVTLIWSK